MKLNEMIQVALELAGLDELPEDSAAIYDTGRDVRRVLAGIDGGAAELSIAHQLGFDCLALHHPAGNIRTGVDDLYVRDHLKKMLECGVEPNHAWKLAESRREQMRHRSHSANRDTVRGLAKLLDVAAVGLHTPADMLAERYVQQRMDALTAAKPLCTLRDVTEELMKIREYREALGNQQPEIWAGTPDTYAGRIYVEMYGVGAPSAEEYIACADAGVGTFICMHVKEDVLAEVKKHGKANIVVAGHMASDSLGFNQILDAWESRCVEVVRVNGIV